MGRAANYLNEKQIQVLRWVSKGANPAAYPEGDFAHRITASALANRGLISVQGSGSSWSAVITAAGEARVAAISDSSEASAETTSSKLFSRVEANGGVLVVDPRADGIDWANRVRNSLRSPSRPFGKKLAMRSTGTWTTTGETQIFFVDHILDTVDSPDVPVRAQFRDLHPTTKAFLDDKEWQYVTKPHVRRAALLYEALTRAAVRDGFKAVSKADLKDGESLRTSKIGAGHVVLEKEGQRFSIAIMEVPGPGGEQLTYSDAQGKMPQWQSSRGWRFVSSGRLELNIMGPGMPYEGRKFRDSRSRRLEDVLGQGLREIEAAIIERTRDEQAHQVKLANDRVEWDAAMERAREAHKVAAVRGQILDQVAKWEEANRISAFIEELGEKMPDMTEEQGTKAELWRTWGRRVAQPEDLLIDLPPLLYRRPADYDLGPFLEKGWSTTPPR